METPSSDNQTIASLLRCIYAFAADPGAWLDNHEQWLELTDSEAWRLLDGQILAPHLQIVESLGADLAKQRPAVEPMPQYGWVQLTATGVPLVVNLKATEAFRTLGLDLADFVSDGKQLQWLGVDGLEEISTAIDELDRVGRSVVVQLRSGGKILLGLLMPWEDHAISLVAADKQVTNGAAEEQVPQYVLLLPDDTLQETSLAWLQTKGLTPTEGAVALHIGSGLSPQEVAVQMGTSINTVRTHVRAIFDKLGVNRQGELVKAVSDLAAIGRWSSPATPVPSKTGTSTETDATAYVTAQFYALADGRQVSFRCYGDPTGVPVFFFHSGWGQSLLLRSQAELLQRAGIAFYSVDRPGFGASDRARVYSITSVADDVLALIQGLGVEKCLLFAGASGIRFAIETARRAATVDIVAITAAAARKGKASHSSPENKNMFVRHYLRLARKPALVESFCRLLRSPVNRLAWGKMFELAYGDCLQRMSESERTLLRAHVMACAADTLAQSSYGVSDELSHLVTQMEIPIHDLEVPIVAWHGAVDAVADINDLRRYLQTAPAAQLISLPGEGQLLQHRHWKTIVAGMLQLWAARPVT